MKHKISSLLFFGIIVFSLVLKYYTIAIIAALFWGMLTSLGVLFLKFSYFLPAVIRTKTKEVLLTFDDGPDSILTPKILDVLKEKGVKAFFFVIAEKAVANPTILQRILDEGHMIGNHTFAHPTFFAMYSKQRAFLEITKATETLEELTGQKITWFRPPIGYTNPKIAYAVSKSGLKVMGWEVRSYDTVYKNAEKFKNRLTQLTKPGSIVLFHDNLPIAAEILSDWIDSQQKKGIQFVSNLKTDFA